MLVTVRAHYCEIDGRVLGGMQLGVLVQVLFEALAHCCKIGGRVRGDVVWQAGAVLGAGDSGGGFFCDIDSRVLFGLLFGQGQACSVGVQVHVFRYLGSMLVIVAFFGG